MNYKEFKAALAAKKAENVAPVQAMAMAAPSEARQRIESKQADILAKLAASKNK